MRQRPVDVNQTTLFIDTQPRPVNRGEAFRRFKYKDGGGDGDGGGGYGAAAAAAATAGGGVGSSEMTEGRAWTLLGVAAVMLLVGTHLVRGNHYAHRRRQVEEAYYGYLEAWDRDFHTAFAASRWELLVEGLPQPLPLLPTYAPSKRVRLPAGRQAPAPPALAPDPEKDPDTAAVQHQQRQQQQQHLQQEQQQFEEEEDGGDGGGAKRRRRRSRGRSRRSLRSAQSSLLSFRAEGLVAALLPQQQVPLIDQHRAAHSGLWRPAVSELRRGRALQLRATDGVTGAESVVELGTVAFMRERSVPAGGEGRCIYEQQGAWQPDATCAVHEYLWALCVKVSRDAATGRFSLNTSLGGGPGCRPEGGWEAGQWRRLDERRHRLHGRMYLPQSARNATTVIVRHDHDPSILEAEVLRRLAPNVEHQILFHAIGLALCFLSIVLLLSVAAFAAPVLLRRLRAGWSGLRRRRRWRRRELRDGSKGSGDQDEEDYGEGGDGRRQRQHQHQHRQRSYGAEL